jgi:hypothetical protein
MAIFFFEKQNKKIPINQPTTTTIPPSHLRLFADFFRGRGQHLNKIWERAGGYDGVCLGRRSRRNVGEHPARLELQARLGLVCQKLHQ